MSLHTMVCKVVRLQTAMVDKLGRQPTVEELALESGLEPKKVRKFTSGLKRKAPCTAPTAVA